MYYTQPKKNEYFILQIENITDWYARTHTHMGYVCHVDVKKRTKHEEKLTIQIYVINFIQSSFLKYFFSLFLIWQFFFPCAVAGSGSCCDLSSMRIPHASTVKCAKRLHV